MVGLYFNILATLLIGVFSQSPPTWGGNPRYTVKVTILNDNPAVVWNFTYYYDWNLKAERYEHEAPQQDQMCLLPETTFEKGGIHCTVTFASDGWSYLAFPTQNFCCKCSNSFGAIRYDWLQKNSNYEGLETVNGRLVTHWTIQGQYLNHFYSTVDEQLPVRFFELKLGNPKSWDFDLNTYTTEPFDPSLLGPQCSTMCGGECSDLLVKEPSQIQYI